MNQPNRYAQIIERIFLAHCPLGHPAKAFEFERDEIEQCAAELGIRLPKNIGDLIYSFRYRVPLPEVICDRAPAGREWAILPAGRAKYRFALISAARIVPNPLLAETKVPDSTPGLIAMYAFSDEQALLATVRYNRLLDCFCRVACFSLQSHLRTTVPGLGQVETDEIYVGIDRNGAHYVIPVQAKGARDQLNIVQVKQDMALCRHKFPALVCRAIGVQFMAGPVIALFEFREDDGEIKMVAEMHYRLVPPDQLTAGDLSKYRALAEV